MVKKKSKNTDSKRICIYLTNGQLKLLDKIADGGEFGKNHAEIIKDIVKQYFDKHHIRD